MTYAFLSDEWLDAVAAAQSELSSGDAPDVTLDLTVTGGPDGDRDLHISGGSFHAGNVDAPTKLIVPYDTARQMFVDGNQQAAMQAFMSGQIKVEGDMTTLMQMQGSGNADPALTARIQELTA
ncbi:MAG: SCP2 sterol-binding domain-containing protein [Actinomycetota bacterium]|nr:SCP2 sterol-binding domain-containing protein [Actinomycetota bacterium]